MSVPYSEALATLMSMFDEVDVEVIKAILHEKRGHLENTVDALLQITGGAPEATNPTHGVAGTQQRHHRHHHHDHGNGRSDEITRPHNAGAARRVPRDVVPVGMNHVPSPTELKQIQNDERYARMIQDREFVAQLRQNPEFMDALRRDEIARNRSRRPAGASGAPRIHRHQPPQSQLQPQRVLAIPATGLTTGSRSRIDQFDSALAENDDTLSFTDQLHKMSQSTKKMFLDLGDKFRRKKGGKDATKPLTKPPHAIAGGYANIATSPSSSEGGDTEILYEPGQNRDGEPGPHRRANVGSFSPFNATAPAMEDPHLSLLEYADGNAPIVDPPPRKKERPPPVAPIQGGYEMREMDSDHRKGD